MGWVEEHPEFCDRPFVNLKLLHLKRSTKNPWLDLLADLTTSQPLHSRLLGRTASSTASWSRRHRRADFVADRRRCPGRGTWHLLSVSLAFSEMVSLHATNDGMELRGTRPVKDDPDALVRIPSAGPTWFGWPDYSTDLYPIDDPKFLDSDLVIPTGYR